MKKMVDLHKLPYSRLEIHYQEILQLLYVRKNIYQLLTMNKNNVIQIIATINVNTHTDIFMIIITMAKQK